jgi:hypothetical protein
MVFELDVLYGGCGVQNVCQERSQAMTTPPNEPMLEMQFHEETGKNPYMVVSHCAAHDPDYVLWLESLVSKTVSDEEIEKEASEYREIDSGVGIFMAAAFITGAKWMRDKLKGR